MATPTSHNDKAWPTTHGKSAREDVTNCAQCHSHQADRALVTKNTDVGDYARSNAFCVQCHIKRPEMHLDIKSWRADHHVVLKQKGVDNCLTCHDIDKNTKHEQLSVGDVQVTTLLTANSVYCDQCHMFSNKAEIPK